jgi:hypothetical protein
MAMAAQLHAYVVTQCRQSHWQMVKAAVGSFDQVALLRVTLSYKKNFHLNDSAD